MAEERESEQKEARLGRLQEEKASFRLASELAAEDRAEEHCAANQALECRLASLEEERQTALGEEAAAARRAEWRVEEEASAQKEAHRVQEAQLREELKGAERAVAAARALEESARAEEESRATEMKEAARKLEVKDEEIAQRLRREREARAENNFA